MSEPHSPAPVWNEAKHRFEIALDGRMAVADYVIEGDRMLFTHTEVPVEFRGKGIAEKLVLAGFAHAREQGLTIVPVCSYVGAILKRHPEYDTRRE